MTLFYPTAFLAEQYAYEVNMLRQTQARIDTETDQVVRNALIDSFCLHARILLGFYEKTTKSNDDDVLASDFTRHGAALSVETIPKLAPGVRSRMTKQIAHLSEKRASPVKIDAPTRQNLLDRLDAFHAVFRDAADPQFRDCFREVLSPQVAEISVRSGNTASAMIGTSTVDSAFSAANFPTNPTRDQTS